VAPVSCSHRDEFGLCDPRNQRPEILDLFNGRLAYGEHMRIYPISNWTEIDVWFYIMREKIELPSIYFAHERSVVARSGTLLDLEIGVVSLKPGELSGTSNRSFLWDTFQ
jgi:sulfate adenylyltransferase subunit 2